ncbi:MAG TPA: NAD-dependent epimerase/dehydratase family protein [Sphingomonas sp.]|nr:NAD-dependent epimerase/dehydratase family protein [Sphingomonas sp.]
MPPERGIVAVTGAAGFIGRNLVVRLAEQGFAVRAITRQTPGEALCDELGEADVVVHLAGANRPADPAEFMRTNRDFTIAVADAIAAGGRRPLVIFASSTKADEDTPYGLSKAAGEAALFGLAARGGARVAVFRLPNVFGRWARPDYNSAVATFCHNCARGLPIRIDDPAAPLDLLHIDDLIDQWLALIEAPPATSGFALPEHVHHTSVGTVAETIGRFASSGAPPAATALDGALYATFVAALPR